MRVFQISPADVAGGAESVAWNLFEELRRAGNESRLIVGRKYTSDPHVIQLPNRESGTLWTRAWGLLADAVENNSWFPPHSKRLLRRIFLGVADPIAGLEKLAGLEVYRYPGTWKLFDLGLGKPDIVHVHNMHGGYFDLTALPWISSMVPTILTIHDAWLLSGHCAHSFECERWRTGCGQCPDLSIPPEIFRDATRRNWQRKRDIVHQCRMVLVAPSKWLIDRAQQSMLAAGVTEFAVIPNGVDLKTFTAVDKDEARALAGLPKTSPIILFVANGGSKNRWKDFGLMVSAVRRIGKAGRHKVTFVVAGESDGLEQFEGVELRRVGVIKTSKEMATFYNAADVYFHAAKADTFPNAVIESLACGTPVVASAVGGIPEQVRGYCAPGRTAAVHNGFGQSEATGILFPVGDENAALSALEILLENDSLRIRLGANAAADALKRFGLDRQAQRYRSLYQKMGATRRLDI
jgi:glycosyltransferase involved in cell wall biosynthesis